MITYGSYLSEKANLTGAVGWVALLAILSSILGGLMVMPAVFAFGLTKPVRRAIRKEIRYFRGKKADAKGETA